MTTATSTASFTRLDAPGSPRGLVLMLHGGKPNSAQLVDGRSASWRRLASMQQAITPAAHGDAVSTWLLRYQRRGWNGGHGPIQDARWALEQARAELGQVPVVLLGHSMGARTAVHVADDPSVAGVVALAPWFDPTDPVHTLADRHLHAAHGRTDKITWMKMTRAYIARAQGVAASAELTDMGRVGHYMLRRVEAWNDFATHHALEMLESVG